MVVGSLEMHLRLDGCFSLKDKRKILRHVLDSARRDFRVAAAEVGDHDLWNVSTLGFAAVGNNNAQVESLLRSVEHFVEIHTEIMVEGSQIEL